MKQKEKIALTILVVLSLGLLSFVIIKKYRKPKNVLLLGGLDNRSGDLSISEQVELVKKGVSYSMSVLFSAGCSKSKDVANALKQKGYNLEYMFIVEPYAKSSTTSQSVRDAVSMGVPMKNVIVGNSESTGLGVINNPTLTPSCSPKHWCSLTELGKIIN